MGQEPRTLAERVEELGYRLIPFREVNDFIHAEQRVAYGISVSNADSRVNEALLHPPGRILLVIRADDVSENYFHQLIASSGRFSIRFVHGRVILPTTGARPVVSSVLVAYTHA